MTFPIAVGTGPRHSSSRPFPTISRGHVNNVGKNGHDGGAGASQDDIIMAMGTNSDETLNATVFICYHFLPIADDASGGNHNIGGSFTKHDIHPSEDLGGLYDDGIDIIQQQSVQGGNIDSKYNVIAELRVQITPATAPFVSSMDGMSSRETKSRVPLGIMRKRRQDSIHGKYFSPNASIEFSSNETHLACLIPLPISYELVPTSGPVSNDDDAISTMVIFRIKAQRYTSHQHMKQKQKQYGLPKLPDYITEKTDDEITSKVESENENMHALERRDSFGAEDHHSSSIDVSSTRSRRKFMSYVAHEPKIVRAPQPSTEVTSTYESTTKRGKMAPKQSFLRQLSGGSSVSSSYIHSPSLQCATCMCNVPADHYRGKSTSAFSLLLVGTADGKLLFVDFALAKVRSIAMESFNTTTIPIVHLSQCTPTQWKPLDIYGEEQGSVSKGRIATVMRDGSVNIYTTSFSASTVLQKDSPLDASAMPSLVENGTAAQSTPMNVDPINGDKTKHTRLGMRIELLSAYTPSTSCTKETWLRYLRAKWLNPLLLVLLTRSPYLDEEYLQGNTNKAIAISTEVEVAQVWTVAEIIGKNDSDTSKGDMNGWNDAPDCSADIALISELKVPTGESLDEFANDTFSLAQQKPSPTTNSKCVRNAFVFLECARGVAVFHHRGTDTLAINSQVVTMSTSSDVGSNLKVRPFCMIWDWKRNVPGLTFASSKAYHLCYKQEDESEMKDIPSLFSCFQLGDDEDDGLCAVHVHEQNASGIARRVQKSIFSLSTLSPLNRFAEDGTLSLNEPSAMLLHRDSVTFPFLGMPSISQDIMLQWEEARVPTTYVSTNGPCEIAAIGKESGHSVAVASSRGLCVLDLSRMPWMEHHARPEKITPCANGQMSPPFLSQSPRWKQFSNVNDEQRFRAVSMDWWERRNREDLLLATVQFADSDSLNLVCWSRKSLGFGDDQLLKELPGQTRGEADEDASSHGLTLPHGFRVHSMSIIKDPDASSNRALLLLSFISHDDGTCLEYVVLQLHAIQPIVGKDEVVLTRISASGNIPLQLGQSPDFYAPESVNGVFLAGGSFLFDLNTETEDQAQDSKVFAVLGIVTLFQGLVAVCINQSGPVLYRPSLLENDCVDSHGLISSYWAAGTVSGKNGCRMAWNIAKNDGKVFCWSVACRNAESEPHSSLELNGDHRPAPFLLESHSILGDICNTLGGSSLWLNGASTSEHEIAMGPFGPSECILYAGQRSRKSTSLSGSMSLKAFHVSNIIVAPPRFTPFLYISFLNLSSTSSKHHALARDHIESTLHRVKDLGSCTSALRVIILKVVEILNEAKSVGNTMFSNSTPAQEGEVNEEIRYLMLKWAVGKAMLREIVSVVEALFDKLGFATFFLSVGRQLEPHQFDLIFPLPSHKPSPVPQILDTAEDLFIASCKHGSLSTALSALPLFSCHEESQQSVTKLVYHCLMKIRENFHSCSSFTGLTEAEDETFLHQLFWFGVKLEDAIEMEHSIQQCDESFCKIEAGDCGEQSYDESHSVSDDYTSDDSSQSRSSTSTYEESSIEQDPDDFVSVSAGEDDSTLETYSSEDTNEISFLTPCRTPRRKPRVGIVKKVVKRLFSSSDGHGEKSGIEEDAIHAAASSFILSGFDDLGQSSPRTPLPEVEEENDCGTDTDNDEDVVAPETLDTSPEDALIPSTVAGAVCLFVENAISSTKDEFPSNTGWKAVSVVAHLIQGDRETTAITSAGSSNAKNLSRMTTVGDILARAMAYSSLGQGSDDDQQSFRTIASMLVHLTSDCGKQIHSQALDNVFNLVLLLLLRHDSCDDVKLCRATLISMGIVTGHLSGRVGEMLDLSESSCDMINIYSHYEAQLNA